ncbi:hypothetical protein QWJ34_02035 [Saccharibacillus sp. CPCC 101409]|uniref:WD40/YVTN/BNR-like repeat-containing protein n=1 Tax=Saccharibacillus sp. CPCC 101409 TaxID=3058041 RepID=UPI002672EA2E|nr:hypothetical protein [Saccharibacillus sp. CPCC 101409]MDO3408541.1 hypothetical protein [Saccharibacillus sp. CPCC 101409]
MNRWTEPEKRTQGEESGRPDWYEPLRSEPPGMSKEPTLSQMRRIKEESQMRNKRTGTGKILLGTGLAAAAIFGGVWGAQASGWLDQERPARVAQVDEPQAKPGMEQPEGGAINGGEPEEGADAQSGEVSPVQPAVDVDLERMLPVLKDGETLIGGQYVDRERGWFAVRTDTEAEGVSPAAAKGVQVMRIANGAGAGGGELSATLEGSENLSRVSFDLHDDGPSWMLGVSGPSAGMMEKKLYRSDDGRKWTLVGDVEMKEYPNGFRFKDEKEGWVTAGYRYDTKHLPLYHTTDGGLTWQTQEIDVPQDYASGTAFPPVFEAEDPQRGILGVSFKVDDTGELFSNRLYATEDGGQTWAPQSGYESEAKETPTDWMLSLRSKAMASTGYFSYGEKDGMYELGNMSASEKGFQLAVVDENLVGMVAGGTVAYTYNRGGTWYAGADEARIAMSRDAEGSASAADRPAGESEEEDGASADTQDDAQRMQAYMEAWSAADEFKRAELTASASAAYSELDPEWISQRHALLASHATEKYVAYMEANRLTALAPAAAAETGAELSLTELTFTEKEIDPDKQKVVLDYTGTLEFSKNHDPVQLKGYLTMQKEDGVWKAAGDKYNPSTFQTLYTIGHPDTPAK